MNFLNSLSPQTEYNARQFRLAPEFVRSLMRLEPRRSLLALALGWLSLAGLIAFGRWSLGSPWFFWIYVPLIFFIAGRFGVLLQLIHEGAHRLLAPSKKTNDALARWLCAYPVGVFYDGYVSGHMKHHAWTNTSKDTPADTEKYKITDFYDPKLYLLLLKDLLGITALGVFFIYKSDDTQQAETKNPAHGSRLKTLFEVSLVQLVILTVFFQWDIVAYLLLWIVPAVSPHMFLMRLRGIAEHGLSRQLGVQVTEPWQGNLYTRSFLTSQNCYSFQPLVWLEKSLIGSCQVYHHHEHHLFPTVPFYHLRELHEAVCKDVQRLNPDVYAKGYFSAAFRSLLEGAPVLQLAETPA